MQPSAPRAIPRKGWDYEHGGAECNCEARIGARAVKLSEAICRRANVYRRLALLAKNFA
jgi:hypothetical protein